MTVLFTNDGFTTSSPGVAVNVVSGTAVTAKAEAG